MSRIILYIWLVLVLCQCATKHQPIEFAPYFPDRPETRFEAGSVSERDHLEAKGELNRLEKRRLWELYLLELRELKPASPRYVLLSRAAQNLQADAIEVEKETAALQAKVQKYRDPLSPVETPRLSFTLPDLKRAYLDAYHLWNKDHDDLAMKKIQEIVHQPEWKAKATRAEWFKVLRLQFRVALDVPDLIQAQLAFQDMASSDSCSPDTTEAGFLMALHAFAAGDPKRAAQIFDEQCDSDKSPSNLIRRAYWQARFREVTDPPASQKLYDQVLRSRMPGYYVYLANSHLGHKIEVVQNTPQTRQYLAQEFPVSGEVNEMLVKAERRLKANLRKEAQVYLLRASHLLKAEVGPDSIFPLLYTAHLFQAAGDHLEAIKIYAVVTTELNEDAPAVAALKIDFLPEMFPRPYEGTVEVLARQWGTDPDFVYAIMRQESAFNPGAVSVVDARGLMQLMPSLGRSLSHQWSYQTYYSDRQLFDADENLKLSTYHLSQLKSQAPHVVLMTAAYNAGLARVGGWWKRNGLLPLDVFVEFIPINETRNYVKLVLRNYIYYKALRNGGTVDSTLIPFQLPPYRPDLFASRSRSFALALGDSSGEPSGSVQSRSKSSAMAVGDSGGEPSGSVQSRSKSSAMAVGDILRRFAFRK